MMRPYERIAARRAALSIARHDDHEDDAEHAARRALGHEHDTPRGSPAVALRAFFLALSLAWFGLAALIVWGALFSMGVR